MNASHHRFNEVIVWQSPEHGADLVTHYRVQWRLHDEGYTADREQIVSADDDPLDLDETSDGYMIHTAAHDMYSMRVTAVAVNGDEQSSEALSPYSPQRLEQIIRDVIVYRYQAAHPWLSTTWAYIQSRAGFFKTYERVIGDGGLVRFDVNNVEPLRTIDARTMTIRTDFVNEDSLSVLMHELAHVYTLVAPLSPMPEAVAVAHLYFQHMIDNSGTMEPHRCYPAEFYADTVDAAIPTTGADRIEPTYWYYGTDCTNGASEPTEEAKQVVLSSLRGQTPQWLQDTYGTGDGGLDLEAVWSTVRNLSDHQTSTAVLYQLKDSFGGYCNPARVQTTGRGLRNPWSDGGCIPKPPENVEATPGDGTITVTWDPPDYDGGRDITHYVVQWSTDGDYSTDQRTKTVSADTNTATVDGLVNDILHTVRVVAVNRHDDDNDGWGNPSKEATTTPTDAANNELTADANSQ